MRIAYLCTDFGIPVCGAKGAAIHVRSLSQALRDLGHEVAIITPRAGGAAPPGFTVPIREYPLDEIEKAFTELLRRDPAGGEAAAREVRAALYTAALRHRARGLLDRFAPDLIYERHALCSAAGVALARDLGVPLILEVNAPLAEEQAAHRGLAFGQAARDLEREILCAADRVVVVSAELGRWATGRGVAPERLAVMPNGVDTTRFAAAQRRRVGTRASLGLDDHPVIGFVGTLKPWHGTATLLRAFALLRRRGVAARLLIVGDGPERAALGALAAGEGIAADTSFTGVVPHERVPEYVAAMDLAVAPYDQTDGFYFSPLKLFEYMAAARPVVAAGVGQIRECVRHGETGWLYPPGDTAALADGLAELLGDPARATALGRAGRDYVRERHTWGGNARAVIDLARPLVPRRAPAASDARVTAPGATAVAGCE